MEDINLIIVIDNIFVQSNTMDYSFGRFVYSASDSFGVRQVEPALLHSSFVSNI